VIRFDAGRNRRGIYSSTCPSQAQCSMSPDIDHSFRNPECKLLNEASA
jgi:hypothetical protein